MDDLKSFFEAIKKRVKKIKEERSIYTSLLDFFEKILTAELNYSPNILISEEDLRKDLIQIKMEKGLSLIKKEKAPIDIKSSWENFQILCKIAENTNQTLGVEVRKILKTLEENNISSWKLYEEYLKNDKFMINQFDGINIPLLKLLLHYSIQPSFKAIAQRLKPFMIKIWDKGYCPICGSSPYISALREEGKRTYYCSFCSYEWESKRLFCPFCENTLPKNLSYLYLEREKEYRVELCDKCKGYIKTVDTRILEGILVPELEDISTIHLNLLAEEKGFQQITSDKNINRIIEEMEINS